MGDSTFLRHEACPKCGSSNNLARYSDGHAHCFSTGCGYYERGNGTAPDSLAPPTTTRAFEMTGVIAAIPDRKITQKTAQKFGVTVEFSPSGEIVKHHYPYYEKDGNKPTGTKVRQVDTKGFYATGSFDNVGLFGQQAWSEGGKYITITEGEADAMAVCEMFDGKWPVVSIRSGAAGASKDIKANLEWLRELRQCSYLFRQRQGRTGGGTVSTRVVHPQQGEERSTTFEGRRGDAEGQEGVGLHAVLVGR